MHTKRKHLAEKEKNNRDIGNNYTGKILRSSDEVNQDEGNIWSMIRTKWTLERKKENEREGVREREKGGSRLLSTHNCQT